MDEKQKKNHEIGKKNGPTLFVSLLLSSKPGGAGEKMRRKKPVFQDQFLLLNDLDWRKNDLLLVVKRWCNFFRYSR